MPTGRGHAALIMCRPAVRSRTWSVSTAADGVAIVYFDSGAFMKLLVDEQGSDLAAALWDGCDTAISSRLAYPEVRAALAAAARSQRLTPVDHTRAEAMWEEYWAATRAVDLSGPVARHAGKLTVRHALRGSEAVHLASALAVGARDTVLAVWDQRLQASGKAAGLRTAPA